MAWPCVTSLEGRGRRAERKGEKIRKCEDGEGGEGVDVKDPYDLGGRRRGRVRGCRTIVEKDRERMSHSREDHRVR